MRLTDPPNEHQLRLLETIYAGRKLAGQPGFQHAELAERVPQRVGALSAWPRFRYVETTLHRQHSLSARQVIAECPSLRLGHGPGGYGWVWTRKPNAASLEAKDELALTVAGMIHVRDAWDEVAVFLSALRILVDVEQEVIPMPTDVEEPVMESVRLQRQLEPPHGPWRLSENDVASLAPLLAREPGTWHCRIPMSVESARWSAALSPFLRDYEGVESAADYLERVAEILAPPIVEPEPDYPSALTLAESIDYLNAVWRLHAEAPLVRIARAEAAAKLALGCSSMDELDSRLSAICGILSHIRLPADERDHSLDELKAHLAETLSPGASGRAIEAVDDLRALFDLRAWRQHGGSKAERKGLRGSGRLKIALPTAEPGAAWHQIQARTTNALATLREEMELHLGI